VNTLNTDNRYGYDALGNLIRDTQEGIGSIQWTVAGKVRSVTQTTLENGEKNLEFGYGAHGHRIHKGVFGTTTDPAGLMHRDHYVHDAQGNVMAIYRYTEPTATEPALSFILTERPIYGSSRLGLDTYSVELAGQPAYDPETAPDPERALRYELTDHLGNVMAVISDNLVPVDIDGDMIPDANMADLVSSQDYEPFGSLLPGRNYSSNSYNYGFQGQLKDDEINGATGTNHAFEYRMHDPRIGRFWSVDPLSSKYPHNSPYAFSENRLIDGIEFEGLEVVLLFGGGVGPINDDLSTTLIRMQTDIQTYSDAKGLGAKVKAFEDDLSGAVEWFNQNHVIGDPIILYGYSAGGERANHLANLLGNEGFKVDMMVTVDPAMGLLSAPLKIPSNVVKSSTYYQTDRSTFPFLSRGYPAVPEEGNTNTNIVNKNFDDRKSTSGSKAHGAMAGDTYENATNLIKNELHDQNDWKLIAE